MRGRNPTGIDYSRFHVPSPEERYAKEAHRQKITRRAFLFGGFITSAAAIAASFIKRAEIVKGSSHIGFEKLAGDLRRHLNEDVFHIYTRPAEAYIAQAGDKLHYPPSPPELVKDLIETEQGQSRFQQAIQNLYYNGIIICEGLTDDVSEQDVKTALDLNTSRLITRAFNERIGEQRIDTLNTGRKVKGALVDDTHAVTEILDYLLSRPDQSSTLPITFNRPPFRQETDSETGKTITYDAQHEAALKRRRSRKKPPASAIPATATPVAAAGALRKSYNAPYDYGREYNSGGSYGTTTEHTPTHARVSRRQLLKFLVGAGLGIPAIVATGAATATTIDSAFSFELGLDTVLKDKVNKEELFKIMEEKLPILMNRPFKLPGILTITTVDGKALSQLAENGQYRRQAVYSELPSHLIDSIVAIEDGNFWNNAGVELSGIIRAAKTGVGGGATLSQQLVESLCWTEQEIADPEKNYTKKMAEILMSAVLENQLEREFRQQGLSKNNAMRKAKETIIEAYCNMVPFGTGVYGVKAASDYYFGKPVKDLDLAQSTFLAGMPQGPSFFDPHYPKKDADIESYLENRREWGNISTDQYGVIKGMPKELIVSKTRQAIVLNRLVNAKKITQQQVGDILKQDLKLLSKEESIKRRTLLTSSNHIDYYAQYVHEQLASYLPPELAGTEMTVATTIDLKKQKLLETTVEAMLPQMAQYAPDNVAVFVRNIKTGAVVAVYGDQTSTHPPGSSVKPMTYAMALERGDVLQNGQAGDFEINTEVKRDGKVSAWKVTNWGLPFFGWTDWKVALARSYNCAASNTAMKMGTMQLADSLERSGAYDGLTTDDSIGQIGWTMTLGTRDTTPARMATAYGVLGNKGVRVDPAPIVSIAGPDGKSIYRYVPERQHSVSVYDPRVASEIVDALGNNAYRPNTAGWAPLLQAEGEAPFFSKTGTAEPTEKGGHGWTVGVCGDYSIAVYMHFGPGSGGSGLLCAAPIFREVKKKLVG